MKKTNISKFIAVGLCICALTGCGASPNEKPDTSNPIVNSNTNEENTNGSSENKGNDILESANLRGSVLEFTDNGCLVNQAKDIEGGAGIKIEAPGMENKDNAVSVTYNPDCEFVIATVNAQSGVTNVTTGSISDVKKQSEVYLYGEFADTLHFNATKVVIAVGNRGVKYEVLSTWFSLFTAKKRKNHSFVDCFDTCKQYDFRYKHDFKDYK